MCGDIMHNILECATEAVRSLLPYFYTLGPVRQGTQYRKIYPSLGPGQVVETPKEVS